jgi:hypothetical protein
MARNGAQWSIMRYIVVTEEDPRALVGNGQDTAIWMREVLANMLKVRVKVAWVGPGSHADQLLAVVEKMP